MYCVHRNGQGSGEHHRRMHWKTTKSLHLARSSFLHGTMLSSVVVAQAAAHRLIVRKPVGGSDEVGKIVDSHCGRQ